MSRVLVTGGVGAIGAAVVRRLLADPDYEVRVSDRRAAPQWMREGCEVHGGDLRVLREARAAMNGCSHVIHTAAIGGGVGSLDRLQYTLMEVNNALNSAVIRAALEVEVERLVYVSSATVFERAEVFPTPEEHLAECRVPESAYGFSKLTGEMYCRAAHVEHDLRYTICRPFNAYGPGELPGAKPGAGNLVADLVRKVCSGQRPLEVFGSGEQTRTLTHVEDVADGLVAAMSSPGGLNEDFNIAGERELTVAALGRLIWEACGEDLETFELRQMPGLRFDVERRWPSVEKARRLLGWQAHIGLKDGIGSTVSWLQDAMEAGQQASPERSGPVGE